MDFTPNEVATLARDVFVGFSAATTAGIAVIGLQNWRRELRGKTDFEVARQLVRATYKLRDEIQWCRWPIIAHSEFPEGSHRKHGKGTADKVVDDWAHVYTERWKPVQSALREFDAQSLEAEALWGTEIRIKTRELHRCVNQLLGAINAFIRDKQNYGESFRQDREFAKKVNAALNSENINDDNNELSRKIKVAVQEIDDAVRRPHWRRN